MHPLLAPSLVVSCDGCPVRGQACADCLVTTMWAQPLPAVEVFGASEGELPLDADESRSLQVLVRAGMVTAVEAAGAVARRDDGPARAAVG